MASESFIAGLGAFTSGGYGAMRESLSNRSSMRLESMLVRFDGYCSFTLGNHWGTALKCSQAPQAPIGVSTCVVLKADVTSGPVDTKTNRPRGRLGQRLSFEIPIAVPDRVVPRTPSRAWLSKRETPPVPPRDHRVLEGFESTPGAPAH